MAASYLTSYLLIGYANPSLRDIELAQQMYIGILALSAFVFGLAGAMSAIKRWSLFVSVLGATLITCWGLVNMWYALMWMVTSQYIGISVTWGTLSIFFGMLAMVMVVGSREQFTPHALSRAANS